MDSIKFVIQCCGFVWITVCLLWISVDLHGCIDFRKVFMDYCGFAWIPLRVLLSVVDLYGSP